MGFPLDWDFPFEFYGIIKGTLAFVDIGDRLGFGDIGDTLACYNIGDTIRFRKVK